MTHNLRLGDADQIAYFRAFNTDGSPKVDLSSATTGLSLSVFRIGAAAVAFASLSDKAADNSTHADGAIRNIAGNLYSIDLPDAASATQVPSVAVRGSFTGGYVEGLPHAIVDADTDNAAIASAVRTNLTQTPNLSVVVATFDEPAIAELNAGLDVAGVTLIPAVSFTHERAGRNYLLVYVAETSSVSITVLDSANQPVDLSAKTLAVHFAIERTRDTLAEVTSGISISGSGSNVITFAIPSEVTETAQRVVFAVRDASSPKTVYAGGVFDVQYLPS